MSFNGTPELIESRLDRLSEAECLSIMAALPALQLLVEE
jgi:hypothetical protein